jgi:hypothetical protein
MVAGLKSKDYKKRCQELGLETLEQRRKKQDLALVHKQLMGSQPNTPEPISENSHSQ